jgi:predicted methyltransferase
MGKGLRAISCFVLAACLACSGGFAEETKASLLGTDPADTDRFRGWELTDLPERDIVFRPYEVIELSGVKEGDVVADIGCGAGYFTFKLARLVGASGWVLAVDCEIPQDLAEYLTARVNDKKDNVFQNITVIRNREDDVMLPHKSLDAAFMCGLNILQNAPGSGKKAADAKVNGINEEADVKMVKSVLKALKPGGRLILIDYYTAPGEEIQDPISRELIARDPEVVKENYLRLGFEFVEEFDTFKSKRYENDVSAFMKHPMYDMLGPIQKFFTPWKMFFFIFKKPAVPAEKAG